MRKNIIKKKVNNNSWEEVKVKIAKYLDNSVPEGTYTPKDKIFKSMNTRVKYYNRFSTASKFGVEYYLEKLILTI